MTKHLVIPVVFVVIAIGLFTCNGTSTEGDHVSAPSFSCQYSKCLTPGNILRHDRFDSVFVYSFTDSLSIDFSVIANCCPDSDRFSVSPLTGNDTIVVSVIDTAKADCRCGCLYMIHAEFSGLPNDQYVVCCNISDSQIEGAPQMLHNVNVYREK